MHIKSSSKDQPFALKAAITPISQLAPADKTRMFELMRAYYDSIAEQQFLSDLSKKDAVILLKDRSGAIQGFSTLASVRVNLDGKTLRAIFSGDTVIDKRHWGQRALGKAFLRYLFVEKAKSPFAPLYWLLISKGYKTYLMMANNFSEHYPRFDRSTPARAKRIMDSFYSKLYPANYNPQTGLIETPGEACRLKSVVAAIPAALAESNPRIAFFARSNPQWREGAELACIARMTLWMPLQYALKVVMTDRAIKPLQRLSRFALAPLKKRDQDLR
jgi:hypothetical protein